MHIWLNKTELQAIPTSGVAYADCLAASRNDWGTADIHDSTYDHPIGTLAGALVAARTNEIATLAKTQRALRAIIGTEVGPQEGGQEPSLAVSRKLSTYIVAADIIDFREASFVSWVTALLDKNLSDGRSVTSVHRERPNNWGTMAGASRSATLAYLGKPLDDVVKVHKGWLGDRASWAGFKYGDLSWQADKAKPVGVNPKGSKITISGALRVVDGVQPDDQRRTGFQWPPARGNYPWGALGSILVTTEILRRAGFDSRSWVDSAVLRAAQWLYSPGANPPQGDDCWQPSLLAFLYPAHNFSGGNLNRGKHMAFTQWTHAGRTAGDVTPTPPPITPTPTPPEPEPTPPPVVTPPPASADIAAAKAEIAKAQEALARARDALN